MDFMARFAKPWVHRLITSFIGSYVENLDPKQLDVGLQSGKVNLTDLILKKSALDKLDVPFGIVEGRIGKFGLNINWSLKGSTPLQVTIEDVQLLIAASSATEYSREDDEKRQQQLKQERLDRAESLRLGDTTDQANQSQSFYDAFVARIINNAQVDIKNVHLRYEDSQTVHNHPFAMGITLAKLTAVTVDGKWQPTYLDGYQQSIHKLAHLDSLAVYFNTDSKTLGGLEYAESKKRFREQISSEANPIEHQYILRPVSGEGRVTLNKVWGKNGEPHYDAQLLFQELGFTLDNHQYRDLISLADEYHIFARQHKYRRYRPDPADFKSNKPKALWKFALTAIRDEIHDKHSRWTWEHFRIRRDQRYGYVGLFKKKETNNNPNAQDPTIQELVELEKQLSYNDIRFYRSIARSQLKKDKEAKRALEQKNQQSQSWSSWLWGSTTESTPKTIDSMTEEERKHFYEIIDYDDKADVTESFEASRDTVSAKVRMHLKQGSLRLKRGPHEGSSDIISLVFDSFEMGGVQRTDNFEASLSLGNFRVFDGTTKNTQYTQIVHVKDGKLVKQSEDALNEGSSDIEPFFSAKYEFKPLDNRADNGLTVKLRSMEIIYQRSYVEAIVKFFKPPESQLLSVEALLNVAGDTFQGIQKETRAGLEYALETHKTVDLKLDMHAPIIIIPENPNEDRCNHLVIDAGRVLVESALADKKVLRDIEKKRNRHYSEDDYKQLESMMYDNYSIKLLAAQFVIGDSLDVCREALQAEEPDPKLHLLERINLDFLAQNSIVPAARSIAKLKVSGRLPNLHVNFSDSKYKTLMRLIDVALPRLNDDETEKRPVKSTQDGQGYRPTAGIFRSGEEEYVVDDSESIKEQEASEEVLEDALLALRQHQFELSFQVDSLRATMLRSLDDGSEKMLGDLMLSHFSLNFCMAKFEMKVDVGLRAINLTSSPPDLDAVQLISTESAAGDETDLMQVAYRRAQKSSPDFLTTYDGYQQSVDVTLSTFNVRAVPEHVLAIYDYVMSTFVPSKNGTAAPAQEQPTQDESTPAEVQSDLSEDRIRVRARLATFQVILIDGSLQMATLALSTANVEVSLENGGIVVDAKLGSLRMTDDSSLQTVSEDFKNLVSIDGDDLVELRYETYNPSTSAEKGVNSFVDLTMGALKLRVLEGPLNKIYLFLLKFARLKGIYDAATQAAAQQAAKVERMGFQTTIRAPILEFPVDAATMKDTFLLTLGELVAHNEYIDINQSQKILASLNGIKLNSVFSGDSHTQLSMLDDVKISADVTQAGTASPESAESTIRVNISDVNLHLTEQQYCRLMVLSKRIPGVFAGAPIDDSPTSNPPTPAEAVGSGETDLLPELSPQDPTTGQVVLKKLDLQVTMEMAKLQLYDIGASSLEHLKDHGIISSALTGSTMTLDMRTNGAMQSQLWVKSFTVHNTKPGNSKFREIIPAADHGRDQFHCLVTMSGGPQSDTQVVASVDSPHMIFSVEPVFALSNFFTSAFTAQPDISEEKEVEDELSGDGPIPQVIGPKEFPKPTLSFRFDIHDASVSILEDDEKNDSQAVRLTLSRISLSQQHALVLEITRLGLSLARMGKRVDSVRFLDDIDIKLASESHDDLNRQVSNFTVLVEQEFVFKTSYRDILLITSIVNRAISLFSSSEEVNAIETKQAAFDNATSAVALKKNVSSSRLSGDTRSKSRQAISRSSRSKSYMTPKVIMTTEELKASLKGFRIVLISDLQEAPVMHLAAKSFAVTVTDWSTQLHASTVIPITIDYWNLKNSHWEPLIDPWSFSVTAQRNAATAVLQVRLSSSDLLDLNLSSNFIELALATANMWSKEGDRVLQKARGSYAPYKIVNRTGGPIHVWSDTNGNSDSKPTQTTKVENGSAVDWRFDDWRKMREDGTSSSSNSIGIKFESKPWERLRSVPVDREGEFIFSLRPRTKSGTSKLMCEVVARDNIKVVTLRSTYKVANQTFYPLEIALVDDAGHPISQIEKIAPGEDFALPIEAVSTNKIRIQPDPGFGYKWSQGIWWEDLQDVRRAGGYSVRCPHMDKKEAPFHFTLCPVWSSQNRDHPELKLNLRAPIELENLLPYDIQYKVFDKNTNHNWNSFLRQGGNTPVHSIDLTHLVLLSITIQDNVFQPSDFTIINADKKFEFEQESQVTLQDYQGRKLVLNLNYVKYADSGGAFKVQIYSPFIVVNKTGLPFSVKSIRSAGVHRDVAGPTNKEELEKSTPFLLSHVDKKGNDFVFKIGDSQWSATMRFDAPSAETAMVMPHVNQKSKIHVGLNWAEGMGKYKLTKVIELTPRFFVYNKLRRPLCFREVGAPPSAKPQLQPGERSSMLFMRMEDRRLLTLAYPGLDAQWSAALDMEALGIMHIRMCEPGSESRQDTRLVVADVILDQATIYVVVKEHGGSWPMAIENKSQHEIAFGQIDDDRERPEPELIYRIAPGKRMPYAWDFPAVEHKKIYISCNKRSRRLDIMEIGALPPLKHNTGAVSLDVRVDGPSQLLVVSDYTEETSIYKPRRRSSSLVSRSDSISSGTTDFEAIQDEVPPNLKLELDLKGIGVSLMNKQLLEIVYMSSQNVLLSYTNSPVAQSINIALGTIQVDNQLHDAFFPVLLQPTPLSKEARSSGALPTLQASVIILNDSTHGVMFVKYASILLQALTVQIDEAFLYAVLDLTKLEGVSWETETDCVLIRDANEVKEPVKPDHGQDVYFEVLELQPVILSVSFVRNTTQSNDETQAMTSGNPLAIAFNVLTMTLANAEDVVLQLNALGLSDVRLTLTDIQARIMYHYKQEVLRQIYRVLGSADFLGNPVGLFTNVSSGVVDIFYEPWHGVVQHGGSELGVGIAKGAASFVKKTVFGLSNSLTKVTSSFGKGLSAATMDADFQAKRRMAQRKNRPRHALIGVASGAEAFANSVASGVEGVLMKPIEGADSEGAAGFFKGLGKGLVGVVTKPVVGVFDLAANVSEGIRNTTTVFDAPQRDRVRKPRQIPSGGILEPYSRRKALGQSWMRDLSDGQYRKEFYIAHIDLPGSNLVALLTNTRIITFTSRDLRVQWDMPFMSVAGVQGEHSGIRFSSKTGKDHDKILSIQDAGSKEWFFTQVKAVVLAFNARRRLER